jgi:hypothetical protein
MGECGCTLGNQTFKLKAPFGWYVIEFMCGCGYCSVSPGMQIYHPKSNKDHLDNIENIPDLPPDCNDLTLIQCGLSPETAKEAAVKNFTGSETEDDKIDDVLAEILGEDLWQNVLRKAPFIVS